MTVADLNQPTATLRRMARAIAMARCSEAEAMEFLELAFRIGSVTGKRDAYRAQTRAMEAAAAERRANKGVCRHE